jgi:hypothetical protein
MKMAVRHATRRALVLLSLAAGCAATDDTSLGALEPGAPDAAKAAQNQPPALDAAATPLSDAALAEASVGHGDAALRDASAFDAGTDEQDDDGESSEDAGAERDASALCGLEPWEPWHCP